MHVILNPPINKYKSVNVNAPSNRSIASQTVEYVKLVSNSTTRGKLSLFLTGALHS